MTALRDVHNSFKATLDHGAPSRHDRYLRSPEAGVDVKRLLPIIGIDVAVGDSGRWKSLATPLAGARPTAFQCESARQNANDRAPTNTSVTAQVASRLNQLRDTNFSPR
jgi:hypothetical protein